MVALGRVLAAGSMVAATLAGALGAVILAVDPGHPQVTRTVVSVPSQADATLAAARVGAAAAVGADQVAGEAARRQQREAALTEILQGYDRRASVDLAVTVVDHLAGLTYSYNGQALFETASIVKVDILATLLLQARHRGRALTAEEQSLARTMIEYSDNSAADGLWTRIGGAGGLKAALRSLGLTVTVPGTGGVWGLTRTTASEQAQLLEIIVDPAGPFAAGGSAYLLGLMRAVAASQAWGVSAARLPGESVAVKNGWLPRTSQSGRWIVNSIGRITDADTDATVVVLSRGHATMSGGVAMVEQIAGLTREYLGW